VDQVRAYVVTPGCRRAFILATFGHAYEPPCGACDRCRAAAADGHEASDPVLAEALARFPLGSEVNHVAWGPGTVERHEPGILTVRFRSVGHRQLALDLVLADDLLRPVPWAPAEGGAHAA
jgi:ATP-dependent DNA helicase RecQ